MRARSYLLRKASMRTVLGSFHACLWLCATIYVPTSLASPAFAQGRSPKAGAAEAETKVDADEIAARAHFEEGREAFESGEFTRALEEFSKAYALSKRPQLLFNIGAAHDRLRHDGEALAAFEQYLAEVPEAGNGPEVRGRIAILRAGI